MHVDGQAAGAGGRVDEDERVLVGALDPVHRRHHGGRGLVVRPGVGVDARLGLRCRAGAGLALDDGRVAEERRLLGRLGELAAELAERQVLAALADQPEGRDVPERRRAAVAEHDLVALGQLEQLRAGRRAPGRRCS